ncbi:MAG: TlpA disulfide reductase family protein [Ignavibacteriota bacterium]
MPPIRAHTIAGDPAWITFDSGRPTLIYVFKPECGWCLKNVDSIRALAAAVSSRYRVIGVSLSSAGLEQYVKEHNLGFEIFRDLEENTQQAYGMGATPQTIVISQEGRVVKDWLGSYSGPNQALLGTFFGVSLPSVVSKGGS